MNRSGKGAGKVRIVAGKWRGRSIALPGVDGVRPTPDRVRETLFNWLAPYLHGARVLDLYAGSGVLGIEALSRGARAVTFVENNRRACAGLREALAQLDAGAAATVRVERVEHYLRAGAVAHAIVFADPPYTQTAHADLCKLLAEGGHLEPEARVYLEQHAKEPLPGLPGRFRIEKNKQAGQVRYLLAHYLAAC